MNTEQPIKVDERAEYYDNEQRMLDPVCPYDFLMDDLSLEYLRSCKRAKWSVL